MKKPFERDDKKDAERYRKLRLLSLRDLGNLYEQNIRGVGNFDELVDKLEVFGFDKNRL